MSHSPIPSSGQRDDGFRVLDVDVEAAVSEVMSSPRRQRSYRPLSAWSIAASVAVITGLGVALNHALKPEPCVTFACQLEQLTDEELVGMMELMQEDDQLLGLDEEPWPSLY
jgi:hypothetical protein